MSPFLDQVSVTFFQLAIQFAVTLTVILFACIGMVDGLKFRRVRVRYGVILLGTIRGVPAQLIGGVCILAEVAGIGLLIGYVELLRRYCGANAGCFIATPVTGLFDNVGVILINGGGLFYFIYWLRQRRTEVSPPTDKLSYSLPNVYRYVNCKLALAHEPSLNRPEVERLMEFVEQLAPFVVLSRAKQVMDGKRLNAERLAAVFLMDKQVRDKSPRARIALEAVTEVYVTTKQPSEVPRNRR